VATIGAALGDLLVTLGRQAVVDVPANIELHNWDPSSPPPITTAGRDLRGFVADLLLA
jgi:hypothetical protein